MAQENEQLEEAFASDDMVTVCWEPACHMHRLYYWPEEKWVEHNKKNNYAKYTHSICDYHYQQYHEEIEQMIADKDVGPTVETERSLMVQAA